MLTRAEIEQLVAQTGFASLEVREDNVSMEIWLSK
jgi:hypothetical protein